MVAINTGVVSSVGGASFWDQEVSRVIDGWQSEVEGRGEELESAPKELGLHRAFDPEV